ncbi:histidine kinase dimerization/phospho-acceptor domain-containing protein, partial [Parasutterella excrementihominis]|uniref:histidine kinase dimerization/phospho-acceptor domain-containing protein n=1 Tax=Parasutterella excrementihominis TaxID=487175 RepID=UPI003AAA5423
MHQSRDKHLFIQSQGFDLELRMFESGAKDVFCVFVRDATSELQIDRLKDELIGIAAHELKTPLAGVRMAAECLSQTVQDPESTETAAELLESADEMKSRISRWLAVAQLPTGAYEIHPDFCGMKPRRRKALNQLSG